MTLEFGQAKKIILIFLGVFLFTTLFGFTAFLPAKTAQAGLPVADILGTAAQWVIHALSKAWEVARYAVEFAAKKAWDKLVQSWDWIRDNALATLLAAGMKIAAKFLVAEAQKLIKSRKIESYLYYADFLVRNVYALEFITKNYKGDQENQLILAQIVAEGQVLYNRISPQSSTYLAIKNQTLLNPACRTGNISPAAPDYYARVLESKSPECIPSFVAAAYRDATLTALGEAQQAAQEEIRSGQGYKASRPCGSVGTSQNQAGSTTIAILPTASSVICAMISYPAGHAANVINAMVDQAVELITDPEGQNRNSAQLRSFLTNTMATMVYRLIQGEGGESVPTFDPSGRTKLTSTTVSEDYGFAGEVPEGIDSDVRDGDVETGNVWGGVRDERQLRDFWNSLCSEKLPLLYALKAGHYKQKFDGVDNKALAEEGRVVTPFQDWQNLDFFGNYPISPLLAISPKRIQYIDPNGIPGEFAVPRFFNSNSQFSSSNTFGNLQAVLSSSTATIEYLLNTPLPFYTAGPNPDSDPDITAYEYIWQILDDTAHIDNTFGSQSNERADRVVALGRKYWLGTNGWPTAEDIDKASAWVPINWPYFVDKNNVGFIWGPLGVPGADAYQDLGNAQLYAVQNNTTTQVPFSVMSKAYANNTGDLLLSASNSTGIGEMWKLNQNVSVSVNNGVITINSNNYKLSPNQTAYFVEFTDRDGKVKVMVAEKLSAMPPCKSEPFGPPANLIDIKEKVTQTRAISEALWAWSAKTSFARDETVSTFK